ncbi:uroporphyrinogen-III synthase, partial [Ameyamaea chiangmaiensis]|nr:uroporphyrinogen-III synthase [Ameyamaea chiangmaiensis]
MSRTMERVAALGWRPIASPMLRVRAAGRATSTAPAQAVLATSGQALDYLPPDLDRRSPFYAVGDATATRARAAGFAAV